MQLRKRGRIGQVACGLRTACSSKVINLIIFKFVVSALCYHRPITYQKPSYKILCTWSWWRRRSKLQAADRVCTARADSAVDSTKDKRNSTCRINKGQSYNSCLRDSGDPQWSSVPGAFCRFQHSYLPDFEEKFSTWKKRRFTWMLQENVQLPFLLLRNITIITRLIRTPNSKIGKASLFCRTTGQIWVNTER